MLTSACAEPADAIGCRPDLRPGEEVPQADPLADGEPLEGLDLEGANPAGVGQAAADAGLDVTYRYHYAVGDDERAGFSECWCVPPPDGAVDSVIYDSADSVIVFVQSGNRFREARDQPARGWGC